MTADFSTTWNSDPWPPGLYPLVTRGKDSRGRWMHGATVTAVDPVPTRALVYETREPFVTPHVLDAHDRSGRLRLLVPPGEYRFTFERAGEFAETEVKVLDPEALTTHVMAPDGMELYYRDHRWDRFITRENAYRKLTIRPDDVVVDLGAHIGVFSRAAAAAGAHVYAFEPEPDNFRLLTLNTTLCPEVEAFQEAVIADDEDAESLRLWIDAAGDGDDTRTALHSLYRTRGARVPVSVPTVRWSSVLREYQPTIIKVDVEGAERTYDWSVVTRLPYLRGVAVEIESEGKRWPGATAHIESSLAAAGLTRIHHTKGWATVEIWERQP